MHNNKSIVQLLILNKADTTPRFWASSINYEIEIVDWDSIKTELDLIIFNNNVEVTPGWIGSLLQGGQSYADVGTVSPFIKYELLDGLQLSAEQCDKWNLAQWERALVACASNTCVEVKNNIFDCIYIKKELLKEVGIPNERIVNDSENAKKWFMKAAQLGWKHKVSMTALLNGELLYNATESFYKDRLNYIVKEAILEIDKILGLYLKMCLDNGRKKILHYLLADFQEGAKNNVGGTQFHVSDLVEYQKAYYNVFVLARDGEFLRLTEYVDNEKTEFVFYVGEVTENIVFYDKVHEKVYRDILKALNVDIIHVHHTLWMPLNIYYLAHEYGIPIVLSIHDYYYVCPVLQMISSVGELCTVDSCKEECATCLEQRKGIIDGKAYLQKWHAEHAKILKLCSKIIFPSDNTRETFLQAYPEAEEKSCVVGHGIKLPEEQVENSYKHNKLRIAFIGGISDVKGGPVIYDLVNSDTDEFEWYIMGGIGHVGLYHFKKSNVIKTGWYKRYEIYKLLKENEIDIVCILSTVAETFCYTLSEAVAAGIPVIATDVGALGQRMRDMSCGWLVARNATAKDILNLLQQIKKDKSDYREKKTGAINALIKDLYSMGKEYDDIYYSLAIEKPNKCALYEISTNIKEMPKEQSDGGVNSKVTINPELELRRIAVEKELIELKSSPIIKGAIKLRQINFPGKEKIKCYLIKRLQGKYKDKR